MPIKGSATYQFRWFWRQDATTQGAIARTCPDMIYQPRCQLPGIPPATQPAPAPGLASLNEPKTKR